jgi:deoxyribonuclease-4
MKIGAHVSNSGKDMLVGSVNEALNYKANCFMVYLGAPQNSYRKSVSEMRVDEYLSKLAEAKINAEDVIVHAPYIVNLAQKSEEKRQFAVDFISKEVKMVHEIGAKYLVIHPGSYLELGLEAGIEQIIQSLKEILDNTKDLDVVLALETMAGKGSECCYQFEHLRQIMDAIQSERIKVCLDTCHTFDSGYDWVNNYEEIIRQLDKIIGLENVKVIHLNDSKNDLGSRKDRHANIGFGNIGFTTLARVCHDERFKDIVKILETPYIENDKKEKVYPPYKFEIAMLKDKRFNINLLEDIKDYYQNK